MAHEGRGDGQQGQQDQGEAHQSFPFKRIGLEREQEQACRHSDR